MRYKENNMTAKEARTHLRYSGWASRKLMDAARSLNPDDLNRAVGVSHGSIVGTLSHIHFADRIWYSRVVDPNEPVIREADMAALEQQWPAVQQKWEAWADSLQDADLDRVVSYKMRDGTARETPVWQLLLHVVNHATLHRGQAVGMIRQLGVKPPATDLLFYFGEA
jgi:uncharacterized damage-inducible protein DinB